MIKLVYLVEPADSLVEVEWLRDMKIYPATQDYYDWIQGKMYIRIGVVVSPEAAIPIKLRHPLQFQATYKQR